MSGRNRVDYRNREATQVIVNNVNVNVRNNYFTTPRSVGMFDVRWYQSYPRVWYPVHPISPRMWWRSAPAWEHAWGWFAAGFFTHYMVNRILTPVPYYYGTTVYYVDDMVYMNGKPYISAHAYYTQAAEIVVRGQAPNQVEVDEEWMPVGTFAVLETPETDTSFIFQLATNKSGHIAGNMINMETDEVLPIYGAIDPETQRVAMRIEGGEGIYECGFWNLTQEDTLGMLLHFDETDKEELTLVRLSDPEPDELAP